MIYEQEDRSLIIADSKGRTISISSLPLSSHLKSVGLFNDRKAIIFSNHLDLFKQWNNSDIYNEWSYLYGSPDFSRTIKIDTTRLVNIQPLLDRSLTYAYPNPSYGENITIRLKVKDYESIEINIYDLAGFKKASFNNTSTLIPLNSSSTIEIPWDVRDVESGVYFARVKVFDSNRVDQKIIKLSIIK